MISHDNLLCFVATEVLSQDKIFGLAEVDVKSQKLTCLN